MHRFYQIIIFFFLCAIIGFSSQYRVLETHYLQTKATEKTAFWTEHFIKRLPKLGISLQDHNADPILSTIAVGNTLGLANDIIESSQLFQIDYIHPDCLCAVSVGSYINKASGVDHASHISRSRARAVFFGKHANNKHGANIQNGSLQLPIDFHHARIVLDSDKSDAVIYKTNNANLPATYAAVYKIAKTQGKPALLIRALTPLIKEAQFFLLVWYSVYSVLIILLLAALYKVFKLSDQQYYPIIDTFSTSPKHRAIMLFILLFIIFIGVIVGSYYSPDISLIWEYSHDKVKHMIAYFSLTLMGFAACHRFNWSKKIVLVIFVLGLFIELTQPLAGRSASFQDLLANSIGIALGALVASWCGFKMQFKKNTRTNSNERLKQEAIPSDLPQRF